MAPGLPALRPDPVDHLCSVLTCDDRDLRSRLAAASEALSALNGFIRTSLEGSFTKEVPPTTSCTIATLAGDILPLLSGSQVDPDVEQSLDVLCKVGVGTAELGDDELIQAASEENPDLDLSAERVAVITSQVRFAEAMQRLVDGLNLLKTTSYADDSAKRDALTVIDTLQVAVDSFAKELRNGGSRTELQHHFAERMFRSVGVR